MAHYKPKSGNLTLYIILLLIAVGVMFSLKTCSHKRTIDELKPSDGDTIDVAIEYSPLSLYTYDDTLGGLNYDIIRAIADEHNLILKFHPVVSLTDAMNHLSKGLYDILIAEVPMTSEYRDAILFTTPIYLDRQVLVQRKDLTTGKGQIKNQLDLAGDTIWAVANSPIAQRIKNLASEIGDTIYVVSDSVYSAEQLFIMTAVGEIKQSVMNEAVARALLPNYPSVDINTNISFTQFQPWIISRENTQLCDSLNLWIENYKQTQQYSHMLEKYGK
jgi:ABC-type amino acid transport substrate-binding protein